MGSLTTCHDQIWPICVKNPSVAHCSQRPILEDMRTSFISLSIVALVWITACGQSVDRSTIDITPETSAVVADESPTPSDPNNPENPRRPSFGTQVNSDTFAVGVNQTVFGIDSDQGNRYLQIRTLPGFSGPGGYYGLGIGNTGFVGVGTRYHLSPITKFQKISFRAFFAANSCAEETPLYFAMVVDLRCDPLNPKYTTVWTSNFKRRAGQWNTYQIGGSDARFYADTSDKAKPRTLAQLFKNSPSACFVATDSFDLEFKRDQAMAPFLLVHGGRFHHVPSVIGLDDIVLQIGDHTYTESFELE